MSIKKDAMTKKTIAHVNENAVAAVFNRDCSLIAPKSGRQMYPAPVTRAARAEADYAALDRLRPRRWSLAHP